MARFSRRMLVHGSVALAGAAAFSRMPGTRIARAQSGPRYDVVDFGAIEAGAHPEGYAWPIPGGVVGIAADGTAFGSIAVSEKRLSPALWSPNGKLKRLKSGTFGGEVRAMNANGVAVGVSFTGIGGVQNIDFQRQTVPAMWVDDELIELPFPDPLFDGAVRAGEAIGISESGVIVGAAYGTGVSWTDGVPQVAFTPEGNVYRLDGINERGVIAAMKSTYDPDSGDVSYELGRLDGNQFTAVEIPTEARDNFPSPADINQSGVLLTASYTGDSAIGILVEDTSARLLDFREDGKSFGPSGFNDQLDVIGWLQSSPFDRAVPALWREEELLLLQDLIPADSDLQLVSAVGINNDGLIACNAIDEDGGFHPVLLVPVG